MKNTNGPTTTATPFGNIPVINNNLFEVRAGVDARWAADTAACLADSIERIATNAQVGMSPEVTYLVAFVADTIQALSSSVVDALERMDREAQP